MGRLADHSMSYRIVIVFTRKCCSLVGTLWIITSFYMLFLHQDRPLHSTREPGARAEETDFLGDKNCQLYHLISCSSVTVFFVYFDGFVLTDGGTSRCLMPGRFIWSPWYE